MGELRRPARTGGRSFRNAHRSIRRAGAILILTGVLALLGASCGGHDTDVRANAVAPARPAPAVPRAALRVEVIGDSLIRQAHDRLALALSERGHRWSIVSKPREPLDGAFTQRALIASAGRPSDVVVLATSANDALTVARRTAARGAEGARADYRSLLAATIDRFPGRCVVVVNARDASPIFEPEQARLLDDDIEAVAAAAQDRHDVVVVDWASTSRDHRDDWFVDDLEHFGPDPNTAADVRAGAQGYADAIADGVSRCPVATG